MISLDRVGSDTWKHVPIWERAKHGDKERKNSIHDYVQAVRNFGNQVKKSVDGEGNTKGSTNPTKSMEESKVTKTQMKEMTQTWNKMEARCMLLGCCQWMRGHTGYEDVANMNGCPKCQKNKISAQRKKSDESEKEQIFPKKSEPLI